MDSEILALGIAFHFGSKWFFHGLEDIPDRLTTICKEESGLVLAVSTKLASENFSTHKKICRLLVELRF